MKKINILVIGRHDLILNLLVDQLNQIENWEARGTLEDEKAIELFHQYKFDFVVLGSGIPEETQAKFRKLFRLQNPHINIIQHAGGTSDKLEFHIRNLIENQQNGSLNVLDNPFQA